MAILRNRDPAASSPTRASARVADGSRKARYLQILHAGDYCGHQTDTLLDSSHPGPLRVSSEVHKDHQADEADYNDSHTCDEDCAKLVVQHPTSQSNPDNAGPNIVQRPEPHVDSLYVCAH